MSCKVLNCWQNPDVHNRHGKGSQFNPVLSPLQSIPHLIFARSFLNVMFLCIQFYASVFSVRFETKDLFYVVFILFFCCKPSSQHYFHIYPKNSAGGVGAYTLWPVSIYNFLLYRLYLFVSLWWWFFFFPPPHSPAKSSLCSSFRVKCYTSQSCR